MDSHAKIQWNGCNENEHLKRRQNTDEWWVSKLLLVASLTCESLEWERRSQEGTLSWERKTRRKQASAKGMDSEKRQRRKVAEGKNLSPPQKRHEIEYKLSYRYRHRTIELECIDVKRNPFPEWSIYHRRIWLSGSRVDHRVIVVIHLGIAIWLLLLLLLCDGVEGWQLVFSRHGLCQWTMTTNPSFAAAGELPRW